MNPMRPKAAAVLVGLLGLWLSGAGCSGAPGGVEQASADGAETFKSIDEIASVSRAAAVLEVTGVGELRPLPDDARGEASFHAYRLYRAQVLDVLATTEEVDLAVRSEITLGLFAANPEAAPGNLAEQLAEDSTPLLPGQTVVAFIDRLSVPGFEIGNAYTIVRSDQGRYDLKDGIATYRGDGPLAGSTIRVDELRATLEESTLLGIALDQDDPGGDPMPPFDGTRLPTESSPATQ